MRGALIGKGPYHRGALFCGALGGGPSEGGPSEPGLDVGESERKNGRTEYSCLR